MSGHKTKFGVRARLVLIITLLLSGVSGTQYYLNYRQQKEVLSRLINLNHEINQTVRDIDREIKAGAHRSPRPACRRPGEPGRARRPNWPGSASCGTFSSTWTRISRP